jgi:hypothetical protein
VSARFVAACVLGTLLLGSGQGVADEAARGGEVVVLLTDGGRLVGTIVREGDTTLTLRTTSGLELELAREAVASVEARSPRAAADATPPAAAFSEPNDTRLMFAPTGRPLRKGDGYFSDHYVLFPGFAYGLTDNLNVSGGVSIVPGLRLDEQVFYVSSSAGWRLSSKAAFSLGGLYATSTEANEAGALLFGVASFGSSDRSLSVGIGLAATRNEEFLYDGTGNYLRSERRWSFRDAPVLMVGGTFRVGKRLSLVTESWLFPGDDFKLSQQPLGVALRFFGERLSVDAGFVLVADVIDRGFPIPWLSFSYHFGPSRSVAKPRAHGGFPRPGGGRPGTREGSR